MMLFTEAPTMPNILLNAVLTRTCSTSQVRLSSTARNVGAPTRARRREQNESQQGPRQEPGAYFMELPTAPTGMGSTVRFAGLGPPLNPIPPPERPRTVHGKPRSPRFCHGSYLRTSITGGFAGRCGSLGRGRWKTSSECDNVARLRTFAVVIPTFNRSAQLARALHTVLAQTSPDFEVVVVNDGSTDDTERVVADFGSSRVVYVRQDNAGVNVARNHGAARSTAPWLVFLDDDDEVLPGWLEGLRAIIEPGHAVVCCAAEHVDAETGRTRIRLPHDMGPVYDGHIGLFDTGSFAVRRDAFDLSGGYASGLPSGTHKELALRLLPVCTARGWTVGHTNEILVRVNQRRRETRARSHPHNLHVGATYLLEHHQQRLARSPSLLASRYGVAGVNAARLGDYRQARSLLLGALCAEPRRAVHWGRLMLTLVPPVGDRVWRRPEFQLAEGETPGPARASTVDRRHTSSSSVTSRLERLRRGRFP